MTGGGIAGGLNHAINQSGRARRLSEREVISLYRHFCFSQWGR